MQVTAVLSVLALAGSAVASATPRSCSPSWYYGEDACKQNCQGGTCSIQEGSKDKPDYVCVCSDGGAQCGGMFKGKTACEAGCSGDCTLLLLPYECKC